MLIRTSAVSRLNIRIDILHMCVYVQVHSASNLKFMFHLNKQNMIKGPNVKRLQMSLYLQLGAKAY